SDVAARVCTIKAARAVGAAVGRNPLCFVVPCHRVIGKHGDLTGYHWGLTRKRAMLGWEAGRVGTAGPPPARAIRGKVPLCGAPETTRPCSASNPTRRICDYNYPLL
ncbi:MAG: methylated-DNA--[protein]-cysteine S-methyltransferase, partial [Rhodoplanes sp.]